VEQKYYFLSGFPRSGNTLLSTLLNQNSNIAATGHSYVPEIFFNLEKIKNHKTYQNFKTEENLKEIQKNVFFNFYKKWNQKYIIDRSEWSTPFNYNMLQKYCPNEIKLIFLIRDPIEIIKSFLNLCNKYPDFYVNRIFNSFDPTTLHRTEIEEKIEIITEKNQLFDLACMSYKFLKNNKDVLFVNYNDLIEDPKKTIDKIYTFLKIPKFKHTFNIEKQFSINEIVYDDSVVRSPMHTLKTGFLKKSKYNHIKIPKHILEKYKNLL